MFKKARIEDNRKIHNGEVLDKVLELKKRFTGKIDTLHLEDILDILEHSYVIYDSPTTQEEIDAKKQAFENQCVKLEAILEYKQAKVDGNEEPFKNFWAHFNGGFITLKDIYNDDCKILMYVVKAAKDKSLLNTGTVAYILTGVRSTGVIPENLTVDSMQYSVSWMTQEEFENEYFPARIENSGISNEIELSNYAKNLKDFYHGYSFFHPLKKRR